MDKLETMRIFVEAADQQSFVAASRSLKLSAPAVSRSIAQLEASLGVRLFNRTTRHVRLTEPGNRYLVDCKRILEEVAEAEAAVSGSYAAPRGLLSLTAPTLFGQKHVVPIITEYLDLYPDVTLRAVFQDRVVNLLEEGFDVAVRIGPLRDSSFYASKVGTIRRVVCGAPAYLARRGTPQTPADLTDHEIILASAVEPSATWRFEADGRKQAVKLSARLEVSQNGGAIAAAVQGFGLTRVMSYQISEELTAGSLQVVLQPFESDPVSVSIIHLEGRQANAKVRAFVNLAVDRLRANSVLND
ncbi:MAG: LysR family transcriptional regulator [Pseudomonadota bacterium]